MIWRKFQAFRIAKKQQVQLAFAQSGLLKGMAIYAIVSPWIVNPLGIAAAAGQVPLWIPVVLWIVGHLNAWVLLPLYLWWLTGGRQAWLARRASFADRP